MQGSHCILAIQTALRQIYGPYELRKAVHELRKAYMPRQLYRLYMAYTLCKKLCRAHKLYKVSC